MEQREREIEREGERGREREREREDPKKSRCISLISPLASSTVERLIRVAVLGRSPTAMQHLRRVPDAPECSAGLMTAAMAWCVKYRRVGLDGQVLRTKVRLECLGVHPKNRGGV